MVQEFILKAQELMGAELRAQPAERDVVTLSDGSKVRLVDSQIVRYEGKKGNIISYTICTARRIR